MSLPHGIKYDILEGHRRAASGYLKTLIEAVVSQASSNVIEKTSIYRFTKIPPLDLATFDWPYGGKTVASSRVRSTQVPIFMKDQEYSFEQVMSFGHDFKVFETNISYC